MKKQLSLALFLASTLTLSSCGGLAKMMGVGGPTETPTTPGEPMAVVFSPPSTGNVEPIEPSASPTASVFSTPEPSAEPTSNPTVRPTSVPSVEPTPSPTPSLTPTRTPTPTPTPTATPSQDDISIVERTTFKVQVYEDTGSLLDGVSIHVASLNSNVDYEANATTVGGEHNFSNAPAGTQINITVSRPGYTTRSLPTVLQSNKTGGTDINSYSFNGDNALSDKPEVISVTPGHNASGVSPNAPIILMFSEPVDRKTVTDNFAIHAYTTETLSVDSNTTFTGSGGIGSTSGTLVWDKSAFNASWNSDDTELTMSFKDNHRLPSDKDSDRVPDYQVALNRQDGQIKDKSGVTRSGEYFKLTIGNFEETYKFSISTETQKPALSSITAQTAENASSNGDTIKVRFSKPMIYYTLGPTIVGGMNGSSSSAPAGGSQASASDAAGNYYISINGGEETPWSNHGTAIFDANDATHTTVLLLPTSAASTIFAPGDAIAVRVATTVLGPAGNNIDASANMASTVAQ